MPTCSIQDLLDDAACFATLPTPMQDAVMLQLWCDIADALTPSGGGGITNPDAGDAPITNPDAGDSPITNPEA